MSQLGSDCRRWWTWFHVYRNGTDLALPIYMSNTPLDNITVNLSTGAISYPKVEGHELDIERVYRTAERFLPHCGGSLEMAVKHAIHEQLSAARGMASLRRVQS